MINLISTRLIQNSLSNQLLGNLAKVVCATLPRYVSQSSLLYSGQNLCQIARCSNATNSQDLQVTNTDHEEPEPDALYKYIDLEFRSSDQGVLRSYETFLMEAAHHLDIQVTDKWAPPRIFWRKTVLKSAFVHKKNRVQYEIRTYVRGIKLVKMTGSTADTYLEYIERNLPEGVGLRVTRCAIEPLPDFLQAPTSSPS